MVSSFSHLKDKRQNYCDHLLHALEFSYCLFVASVKVFIHGVYPDVFLTSASDEVHRLHYDLVKQNEEMKGIV